jgi:hypothetical protein
MLQCDHHQNLGDPNYCYSASLLKISSKSLHAFESYLGPHTNFAKVIFGMITISFFIASLYGRKVLKLKMAVSHEPFEIDHPTPYNFLLVFGPSFIWRWFEKFLVGHPILQNFRNTLYLGKL